MSARNRRSGRLAFRLVVVAILLFAAAFGYANLNDLGLSNGAAGPQTSGSGSPERASARLAKLPVAPAGSMSGYSREEFPHWSDAREFGWTVPSASCDTRDAALIRDGRNVHVGDYCKIVSGQWRDPYGGGEMTDPSQIDIDHLVPLANAYRSGASGWSEAERERFANAPLNLLAADAGENRSKGDKGPEAWRPPDEAEWCDYSVRWIRVKSAYRLSVNPDEKSALQEMLSTCRASG